METGYQPERNYRTDYNSFVKESLEKLTAHLGNYSGGYQPKPIKMNTNYI
jgi:hypothetical protein